MIKTIGNPVSYAARGLAQAGDHARQSLEAFSIREDPADLEIRTLTNDDLRYALKRGWEDFQAARSDVILLCLLYPVMGFVLAGIGFDRALIPLLFPLASGFVLLGPLAAVGLYEISRRREAGEPVSWASAFGVAASPSFTAIVGLGLYLLALFVVWLAVAHGIFLATLGPDTPMTLGGFLTATLTTAPGWAMIVIGIGTGFVFALTALATSLVSFPLLLDRRVGLAGAIATSLRVTRKNIRVACTWGLIVAVSLAIGTLPLLLGLVVALPVLGHATWHLYRRAVGPSPAA